MNVTGFLVRVKVCKEEFTFLSSLCHFQKHFPQLVFITVLFDC
jgi:hypothetical protein